MSNDTPYERRVSYHFEAAGEAWAVTTVTSALIIFEETRKNGQEDCHMASEAELVDGKWTILPDTRCSLTPYLYDHQIDEIANYFNEHGAPPCDE